MRKGIVAIAVGGSVFALTAAAATSMTVNGTAFNPRVGSTSATTCDMGTLTVASQNDGTNYTGFTVTAANNTAADAGCTGVFLYVYVPETVGVTGNFMKITAKANYTAGTPATFTFDAASGNIYASLASANTPPDPSESIGPVALSGHTMGTAQLLISPTVTANFPAA